MSRPVLSPEYVIFHNLEKDRPHNSLGTWPLHITIAPPFELPTLTATRDLLHLMHEVARDYTPFCVFPGERALFGPDDDVAVSRVNNPSGELQLLHERFVRDIGLLGCSTMDMRWALDKYQPHVKDQDVCKLASKIIVINTLTLGAKTGDTRQIVETVNL